MHTSYSQLLFNGAAGESDYPDQTEFRYTQSPIHEQLASRARIYDAEYSQFATCSAVAGAKTDSTVPGDCAIEVCLNGGVLSVALGRRIEFVDPSSGELALSGIRRPFSFDTFMKILGLWPRVRKNPVGVEMGSLLPVRKFGFAP
jgi:hypothetical protein